MSKLKSVQFATDKRLALTTGDVLKFTAGVPRQVKDHIYKAAMREGGIPGNVKLTIESGEEGDEGDNNPEPSDETPEMGPATKPSMEVIAETVRDMVESGNSDFLTNNGKVTLEALRNQLGNDEVTADDRDKAHKMLESGEA